MLDIFSYSMKKILIICFAILTINAYANEPKLTAAIDRDTVDEYSYFIYTVVYQGKAEKTDLPLHNLNYGNNQYFKAFDVSYNVEEVPSNKGSEYITTWKAKVVVNEQGKRIIPSLELHGLKTPELEIEVNNASVKDWAQWTTSDYKNTLQVGEKVTISNKLTLDRNKLGPFANILASSPIYEYEHVNITIGDICGTCTPLSSTMSVSFDKPGKYSFSPIGWVFITKSETIEGWYEEDIITGMSVTGTEAPELTFTVTE